MMKPKEVLTEMKPHELENCTGPFTDARDCPIHRPKASGEQEGMPPEPKRYSIWWTETGVEPKVSADGCYVLWADYDLLRAKLADLDRHHSALKAGYSKLSALMDEEIAKRQSAESRLSEVMKDAERYRWLRSRLRGQQEENGYQVFVYPDLRPAGNIMRGAVAQHLDAAIDAAMTQALSEVMKKREDGHLAGGIQQSDGET